MHLQPPTSTRPRRRRDMLIRCANGFGALALAGAARRPGVRPRPRDAPEATGPLAPRPPHFPAKAKSVIFLYMDGGPSQVDTFDPKPRLDREHGKPIEVKTQPTQFNNVGNVLKSPVEVPPVRPERHPGQRPVPARRRLRRRPGGRPLDGRRTSPSTPTPTTSCTPATACRAGPSMGAWVTYGLGSECQDLPGFVVLNGGLIPPGGLDYFNSGFLPAVVPGLDLQARRHAGGQHPARRGHDRSCSAASSTCCASSTGASLGRMGEHDSARSRRSPTTSWPSACRRRCPELMDLDERDRRRRRRSTAWTSRTPRRRSSAASACSPAGWSSAACGSSSCSAPNVGARPLGPAQQPQGRATRTTPARSTSRSPAC